MRAIVATALILAGMAAGPADAAAWCPQPWCRKAEALAQRWLGRPVSRDNDIIAPPAGIDPQMALAPPRPGGTLRIIRPQPRSARP
jgi:hypothetical protein